MGTENCSTEESPSLRKRFSDEFFANARHFVYTSFIDHCRAPFVEEFMHKFDLSRSSANSAIHQMEKRHLCYTLQPTSKIFLANPFTSYQSSYRCSTVENDSKKTYFGSWPWDAIGIHFVVEKPCTLDLFCFHDGKPFAIHMDNFNWSAKNEPVFFFSLKFSQWYENLVDTWHNTINIFKSKSALQKYRSENPEVKGEAVSMATIISLSHLFFRNRARKDFKPASLARIKSEFKKNHLSGPFWAIDKVKD